MLDTFKRYEKHRLTVLQYQNGNENLTFHAWKIVHSTGVHKYMCILTVEIYAQILSHQPGQSDFQLLIINAKQLQREGCTDWNVFPWRADHPIPIISVLHADPINNDCF